MADLLSNITRSQVREHLHEVGFTWYLRPTYEQLAAFLLFADPDTVLPPSDAAIALLDEFTATHVAVSREIERLVKEGDLSMEQRRAVDGPYTLLADVLRDFLVAVGVEKPFGEHSLLAGVVFAEHIIAMHGAPAVLAQGECPLRGAVLRWAHALVHGTATTKDPMDSLASAILGRFRLEVP